MIVTTFKQLKNNSSSESVKIVSIIDDKKQPHPLKKISLPNCISFTIIHENLVFNVDHLDLPKCIHFRARNVHVSKFYIEKVSKMTLESTKIDKVSPCEIKSFKLDKGKFPISANGVRFTDNIKLLTAKFDHDNIVLPTIKKIIIEKMQGECCNLTLKNPNYVRLEHCVFSNLFFITAEDFSIKDCFIKGTIFAGNVTGNFRNSNVIFKNIFGDKDCRFGERDDECIHETNLLLNL